MLKRFLLLTRFCYKMHLNCTLPHKQEDAYTTKIKTLILLLIIRVIIGNNTYKATQ